jgi:SAM-dependent methyltransferase
MPGHSTSKLSLSRHRCLAAQCRSCGGGGLEPVLDLGRMPLSDRLVTRAALAEAEEPHFPLEVVFCPECTLVQILETVPAEVLFDRNYPYFSSYSATLLAHSRLHAIELIERRGLCDASLVIELASNDGYMLTNFVERGVPVLGIDPAPGPVQAALARGVASRCEFFTRKLAAQMSAAGTCADVVIANNVLAHVSDTNGFVEGIASILKTNGLLTIEVPYVRELIEHNEFDTIYHEHLCYFSVHALDALFRRHSLYLNDAIVLPIHGGSLRLNVERTERPSSRLRDLAERERALGMHRVSYYETFASRVERLVDDLRELLFTLKRQGKSIAAYGAAAKGAILLNVLGLGTEIVDFVVDKNPHKQGRLMPGVHVPILDPAQLLVRRPDYALILPWNFAEEIMAQQSAYARAGGNFIIPVPRPTII